MVKKVAFHTLGCKVNQYETNAMIQQFLAKDYQLVNFNEFADIYVINTCTVTNMADKKSRQMLRKVKELNKDSVVVAVGCYAQVTSDDVAKIEEIDVVLGNDEKKNIVEFVEEFRKSQVSNNLAVGNCEKIGNKELEIVKENVFGIKKLISVSDINKSKEYLEFGTVLHLETTRAVIKIQDGCNNFCSYCIIPYARGRIRSRCKDAILTEVKEIVKLGIKEVVLTGIHIASYGKDKNDGYYLIDLIEDINKIEGLERIRLGSLEPLIITEDFCERLGKVDKICEHFHLSLQSGCDATLKRMNRKYLTEDFRKCVSVLRKTFNEVSLTTDIIVGFPGETDEEFNQTYEFLKEIKFFKMHVFKYSKRNGTVAASMDGQVDESVKEVRSKKLIELSNANEQEYLNGYLDKSVEVLFEEKKNGEWIGHTKNYLTVKVDSKFFEVKNLDEKIGLDKRFDNNGLSAVCDLKNLIFNVKVQQVENLMLVGILD